MMEKSKSLISLSIQLSQGMKDRQRISDIINGISDCLGSLTSMKAKIMPQFTIDQSQDIEKLLTQEMSDLDLAIEEAVKKLEV